MPTALRCSGRFTHSGTSIDGVCHSSASQPSLGLVSPRPADELLSGENVCALRCDLTQSVSRTK